MRSLLSLPCFLFTISLARTVLADCRSTGTDYVDGGGPYCVNTTSTDYFSFGTEFQGCVASDTQGGVTPILIDPANDEFFCSNIATNPDGAEQRSTCNVAGNEVRKNQMTSGTWIVVIEGLTFAWMRSFLINAAPPVTVTSTPTATFSYTSTPTATSTSTNTQTISTTLTAVTTTVPSTTVTVTKTITPVPVTVTTTNLVTLTDIALAFATTTKITTVTTSCATKLGPWDHTCTIKVSKAHYAAATGIKARAFPEMDAAAAAAAGMIKVRPRFQKDREWAREMRREAAARGLLNARAVDQCTATVIATGPIPSTTLTFTAPTTTVVIPTGVTVTATVTPPPVTSLSGKASTTITITKPTQTITKTSFGIAHTTVTNTLWATITSTVKVKPTGVTCIGS